MIALSLFDGMGCLYISLIEAGFKIDKYYASEIEPIPIRFTKTNFPDIEHLGDVTKWKEWNIDWSKIDLIGAGSPCQGFSFAGKQLNFNDPRSKLFFEFIKIFAHIKKLNPEVLFLLENVNMKKEYQKVINDTLGIFPARLNSNLVSAQNRDRNYWTNIRTKQIGLFGELHSDIPQPKDRGIFIKDIIQDESEVDEKYYIRNTKLKGLNLEGKAPTQRSSTGRSLTDKHNYQIIKQPFCVVNDKGNLRETKKANCIDANYHKGLDNHAQRTVICVAMRGRNIEDGKRNDYKGAPTEQRLEPNEHGKTNCLASVGKDNLIMQLPRGKNNGGLHKYKSPTLTSNSFEQNNIILKDYKLRRLTPIECARLQTIPEWVSFEGFSDTALYKMFGNGWTIEMIVWIISHIKQNNEQK